jgi:hypothetical protein
MARGDFEVTTLKVMLKLYQISPELTIAINDFYPKMSAEK